MKMSKLIFILCSGLVLAFCVSADKCPGDFQMCPKYMTCCKVSYGEFQCCPFQLATCCDDQIHCCPHGTVCDFEHMSCVGNGSSIQFSSWQIPISPEIVESISTEETSHDDKYESNDLLQTIGKENKCPDDTKCAFIFTCCKMYSGRYGCCPFEEGTCCQDGFHCCPHGQKCSGSGSCYHLEMNSTINAYRMTDNEYQKQMKLEQKEQIVEDVVVADPNGKCPDGHPCPEQYTCCKITGLRYGCCPLTEARCCDDGIHCCPKGTNCNTTLGTCDIQKNYIWSTAVKSLVKLQLPNDQEEVNAPSLIEEVTITDVLCPDERYHCPSHTTCCRLESGAFGCCPIEGAVCCNDMEHCCPRGYQCADGGCITEGHYIPHFLKTPAMTRSTAVNQETKVVAATIGDIICPDQYECPDGNTCCAIGGGEYGCCPMEKATCCSDQIHCCPHGYRCIDGGCEKKAGSAILHPFLNAISIKRDHEPKLVQRMGEKCPDLISECPDGSTCCELASGLYACCPFEDAVCCSDKEHCCPEGYGCVAGGCQRKGHYIPHFLKTPAMTRNAALDQERRVDEATVRDVICPDEQSECPNGNSCCPIGGGEYACCPVEKAICCPDEIHCCPNGYRCVDRGCAGNAGSTIIPHFHKAITIMRTHKPKTLASNLKLDDRVGEICPDQTSECPEGQTCCEMASGSYGCCPLENATCCGDMEHCCPYGYWCTDDGCERTTGEPYHLPLFLHKLSIARKMVP